MKQHLLYISKRAFFLASLGFWIVLGGLDLLRYLYYSMRSGEEIDWVERIIWVVGDYLSVFILSFFVYYIFQKTYHKTWKPFLAIHFPTSLLFGAANIALSTLLMMVLLRQVKEFETPFPEAYMKNLESFFGFAINGFLVYWLIMLILMALNFYARYRSQYVRSVQLESQLTQAQLQTLKMQLQPHFLFNALNTIAMMVRNRKDAQAVGMISGLSDLLRQSLAREGEQKVPFEEELALLQGYLEIEQIRFQDRLEVQWEIDPNSKKVLFPSLLLQPIVENAFKYGISETIGPAFLKIKSSVTNEHMSVWVENNGPSLPPDWRMEDQKGIGLSNTRSRLKQMYGDNYTFAVKDLAPQGISVHIMIPVELAQKP